MKEIQIKPFTLRKEYFGGLIHDAKTTSYELLKPEEFSFFAGIIAAENTFFEENLSNIDSSLRDRIDGFRKIGIINKDDAGRLSMVSVRLIPPPSDIPKDRLTAPLRVYDTYTRKCNLACEHCYATSNAHFPETRRTLKQTETMMEKFYDAGTMEWRFTGGEPTIYPDLFDAIRIAKDFGMSVSLNSNGWWSEKTAQKVLGSGISEIVISLEGQKTVNDIRRKPGAFRQTVKTFDRIANYNHDNPDNKINVVINTAVGRDNVTDIEFIIRVAAKYGFDVTFIPLKPSGRAQSGLLGEMLSTEEFMLFSKQVQHLREDPKIKDSGIKINHRYKDLFCPDYKDKSQKPLPFSYAECGALTTAISLLPDGRVFACPFVLGFPEFIGPNMLEVSVSEAWSHSNIERFRKAEKIGCTDCRYYMKQCRGKCRATVLNYGGKIEDNKLIGEDPQCYAKLIKD